jgi:hypothetical protein
MLRRVALVRTDVSEELSTSIIRVTRILYFFGILNFSLYGQAPAMCRPIIFVPHMKDVIKNISIVRIAAAAVSTATAELHI